MLLLTDTIFAPSSSHALRHSAKRHMLAHVENGDNSSSIIIDYAKLYSDSLIQHSASIKAESNHTTTSSLSTESVSDGCQTNAPCHTLTGNCIKCTFNYSCIYGEDTNITCEAINAKCTVRNFLNYTFLLMNCKF